MHPLRVGVFSLLLLPAAGSAQTDSQTLQALLEEVRQLRQDLQATTAASQRAQILLYRVQLQEAATGRELRQLNDARSKLAAIQASRKGLAAQIKDIEDKQAGAKGPLEQRETEDLLAQLRRKIELTMPEEQEGQKRVADCEEQLRLEQAKLSGFQDELDQLDRALKNPRRR